MSQKIQVRRGTNSQRQNVVFDNGEPVWTIDTHKLYVGDGSTTGGVQIGSLNLDGENIFVVPVNDKTDLIANGQALVDAVNNAHAATPYGKSVSATNPYTIILPPALYKTTEFLLITGDGINLIGGTSNPEDTKILAEPPDASASHGIFLYDSSYHTVKDLTVTLLNTGYSASSLMTSLAIYGSSNHIKNIKIQNCDINVSGLYNSSNITSFDIHASNASGIDNVQISNCRFLSGGCFEIDNYVVNRFKNIVIDNCIFYDECPNTIKNGSFKMVGMSVSVDTESVKVSNCSFRNPNNAVLWPKGNTNNATHSYLNCDFSGKYGIGRAKFGAGAGITNYSSHVFTNCEFAGGPIMAGGLISTGASNSSIILPAIYTNCKFMPTGHGICISPGQSGIFIGCSIMAGIENGLAITGLDYSLVKGRGVFSNCLILGKYDAAALAVDSNNLKLA